MSGAMDDAAAAALWMLSLEHDSRRERIGLLYGDDYKRTPTRGQGEGDSAGGAFAIPRGSLRALFHNHPDTTSGARDLRNAGGGERFSSDDVEQARKLKVPSYISTPSGAVRRYEPSTGGTSDVLAQFPIDEFRAYLMKKLLDREPDDPRGLMR